MSVLSVFLTRLSGFLVCILWSCFFFVVLFSILVFLFLLKKAKKTDRAKTQKKSWNKGTSFQLAQLCSQIVFLIFWGWALKMHVCWKHYRNSGLSIFDKRKSKKWPQNVNFLSNKLAPAWVKNWPLYVAQHKWASFCLSKTVNFDLFSCLVFKTSHSPCRRRVLKKEAPQKPKKSPIFDKKAKF